VKRRFRSTGAKGAEANETLPKYTIGVVSRLVGLPPQTLRRYEEAGLLQPARQGGKNRLYSDQDVAVLEEIAELSDQGVNAAGIRQIIQMRKHIRRLQREVQEAQEARRRAEESLRQIQMAQPEPCHRPAPGESVSG
jgi:DNA-binding transcriptional MerR regulator